MGGIQREKDNHKDVPINFEIINLYKVTYDIMDMVLEIRNLYQG